MGISNSAVVVICIIGAAAVAGIGYAMTHLFFNSPTERRNMVDLENGGNEFSQVQYMREVRLRNQETIATSYGHGQRPGPVYSDSYEA